MGAKGGESDGRASPPARPLRRIRAFVWDGALVAVYAAVVAGGFLVAAKTAEGSVGTLFATRWSSQALGSGVLTVPVVIGLGLAESGGAGPGKRRAGLRVERTDGRPPGPALSLLRTALKLLPWELAHTAIWEFRFAPEGTAGLVALSACYALGGVYVATLALNREHRTPYDLLLGMRVVSG